MNLVDCFTPCFSFVHDILADGGWTGGDPREELVRRVEKGVVAASAEFTPATLLRARRLVSLWADNRLGCDDWPGRSAWLNNPLQSAPAGGSEKYLSDLAGHLERDNAEDGQVAMLLLECLGRGFNLDEPCYNGLLGLLAERFKDES